MVPTIVPTPEGQSLTVLGIETSCDETAAAIVSGRPGAERHVLSEVVLSQIEDHKPYGGVVPEIAARAHLAHLDGLVTKAMGQANLRFSDLDAIAVTAGPGLIGGVIVGLTFAKALSLGADKPLIALNHLEGHALVARLGDDVPFPFLLLLVSGGHCQILTVYGVGHYHRLGTTIDDAVGEAFDKAAKLLGLGYPGGPEIERWAIQGDPNRFVLPRPMIGRPGADFSFSGLKTALRQTMAGLDSITDQDRADLAAGFQTAIADCLCDRVSRALETYLTDPKVGPDHHSLVIAGGVAANKMIRTRLGGILDQKGFQLIAPPGKWCTDNAVMIAWAGIERLSLGLVDPLNVAARARWPLDETAAAVAHNRAQAVRAAKGV